MKMHITYLRIGYSVSWENLGDYDTRMLIYRFTQFIQPICIVYIVYTVSISNWNQKTL